MTGSGMLTGPKVDSFLVHRSNPSSPSQNLTPAMHYEGFLHIIMLLQTQTCLRKYRHLTLQRLQVYEHMYIFSMSLLTELAYSLRLILVQESAFL